MAARANRSQSRGGGMALIVHFRRVLDQQDPLHLTHLLTCVLHMRLQQGLVAHLRMQKTIGGFQRRWIMQLLGQRSAWLARQRLGNGHRTPRAARIT